MSSKLILMRHGQSEWNRRNLFTGWVDIPLSEKGIQEALDGGSEIADIPIDLIFVSDLIRAQMTAMIAMSRHKGGKVPYFVHEDNPNGEIHDEKIKKKLCLPVYISEALNERMYGELQGLDKDETREKYGEEQVQIWRRSFDVPPPEGESLELCAKRTLPYFQQEIVPHLVEGKNVFVSAHGNSLRSIVMQLDGLSKEQVLELEIPTGKPIIYHFEEGKWIKE